MADLTPEQIKQGYSNIPGAYDATTGQLKGSMTGTMVGDKINPQPIDSPTVQGTIPGSSFAFSQAILQMQDKLAKNQDLIDQKNKILTQLYDRGLTQEEMQKLTPSQQMAITSNNRQFIDTELTNINDQIKGRATSLDASLNYLTTGYQNDITATEKKNADAINALKDYTTAVNSGGDPTALSAWKQLIKNSYGIDMNNILGTSTNQGNINIYGVKSTSTTLGFGGVDSGVSATDGGTFLSSQGDQTDRQVAQQLLESYPKMFGDNITVDEALKKWSNGVYGAEVALGIDPKAKLADLIKNSPDQIQKTLDGIKTREGISNIPVGTSGLPGTTGSSKIDSSTPGYATADVPMTGGLSQAAIDQNALKYALTGTMPSIGLSSTGQGGMRKSAIMNRAAELEGGANIEGNKVRLSALNTSMGQQMTYLNTMDRSIRTVDDNLQILSNAADKVNVSDSPLINEWTNLAKTKVIGSGDLNAYMAAIQTVRTEYGFILARGGQVSDLQRTEAAKLIPDNITKSQLMKVIGVLKAEGANVKKEAQNQVDSIAEQINKIVAPSSNTVGSPTSGGVDINSLRNKYNY